MMDGNCGSKSFWDEAVGKCSQCSGDVCRARSPDLPESCICYCVNGFPEGTYTYQQKATCGFRSNNLSTNPPCTTVGTHQNGYENATIILAVLLGALLAVVAAYILYRKLWKQRWVSQGSHNIEAGEGNGQEPEKEPLDPKSPAEVTSYPQPPKNTAAEKEPERHPKNGAPPNSMFMDVNQERPDFRDNEQEMVTVLNKGGEETGRKEAVPTHPRQEEGPNDPSAATQPTDHRILKDKDTSTSTPA